MSDGFIKLNRKFFSTVMWNEARTFSSCEAWLDLIQSARFDATPYTRSIAGREVIYSRGQYPASIRFLSKRWKWTERKTRTFLSHLKKEGMITTEIIDGQTIITLCNYDKYNSNETAGDTVSDTLNDTVNTLIENKINELLTQRTTQQATQREKKRHSGDTNIKKEKERIILKESANADKKSERKFHPDFLKFNKWLAQNAPFCANPKNFEKQISEELFFKLKEKYNGEQVAYIIGQIENRKDLRKRYTDLYRTILNWAKKEYG
jgi:hypothetical protein